MNPPPYLESILRLWKSGVIPRGQVIHVDVVHDSWCGMLNGDGICNCRPLVTVRPREAA
jgi:hypothetical protein